MQNYAWMQTNTADLSQCIKAGLADGRIVHIGSSLINANTSVDSLKPHFAVMAEGFCQKLEHSCDIAE